MSDSARIDSIEVLKTFRAALWKFAETANVALGDAESDLRRTLSWLEQEQYTYWQGQIRKRHDIVTRCKEAVRMKKLFKDSSGRQGSAIDEEKALKVAMHRLAVAEQKFEAVKKNVRVIQRAQDEYKGNVQRFATTVQSDIPLAVARLDKLFATLQKYTSLAPAPGSSEPGMASSTAGGSSEGAMTRAVSDQAPDDLPDFPQFDAPEVVLVHTHRPTGLVLSTDARTPAEAGNQYRRFASQAEAEQYARLKVDTEPLIECAIYAADRSSLATVRADLARTPPQEENRS